MNFDGAKLNSAHGAKDIWGVIGCDSSGSIIFVTAKQNIGYSGPEVEEAFARLFALEQAWKHGFRRTILEVDSSIVITKLKSQDCPNASFGLVLNSILGFVIRFDFCSFSHVRRTENGVAHALANDLQPFTSTYREWEGDGPDHACNGSSSEGSL